MGEVRTVICNGQVFHAQRNLYNGLIQLQRLGRTLPIWIDAVCINQTDTAEKTRQVNMMGDIYRAAKLVIVWLGRTTIVAHFASRFARGFFKEDWKAKQAHAALEADVPSPSTWRTLLLFKDALVPINALHWIVKRGWFSRVWTAQETVLAREIIYLLGDHELPLDELVQSITPIKQAWESLADGLAYSVKGILEGPRFINEARSKRKCTLEEALAVSRLRRATNPRDKVFAMLGFCDMEIHADYHKSVNQVYCECAVTLLRSETSLYLLSLVGQIRQESKPPCEHRDEEWSKRLQESKPITSLPSWVPDLSFPTEPTPLRDTVGVTFTAGLDHGLKFAVDEASWTLQLIARKIGSVTGVGHPLECAKHGQSTNLMPAWDYLHLLAGFGPVYRPTGEPTLSAFWKTLAMGSESCMDEGHKSVRVSLQHFVEWFTLMSEEGGHTHPAEMRKTILGLDDNRSRIPIVSAEEIEERRHRKWVFTSTLKLRDMQKAIAIRDFVNALDTPVHGLRQSILDRHRDKRLLQSEPKHGGGGPEPLFEGVYQRNFADRRFFAIDNTYFGLAPWTTQAGDVVMIVAGASVPFIFRKADETGNWRLIGGAYCHGVMFGHGSSRGNKFEEINVV